MRRHDLAYLRTGSPFGFLCGEAQPEQLAAVTDWIARQQPLVVVRQSPDPAAITLALTLPTQQGRQRMACIFRQEDMVEVRPALTVSECLDRLARDMQPTLAELEAGVLDSGAQLGVFGSLSWETLSTESYRHADSDIDLICDIRNLPQLNACLAALSSAASKLLCRLDGELRFAGGDAVAWREFAEQRANRQAQVLVKGSSEVGLKTVATLLASLTEDTPNA
jgi:phosphoribosyl-dephospho-CoA transferase